VPVNALRLTVCPNPSRLSTEFSISGVEPIAVEIFDPHGRLVETIQVSDTRRIVWEPSAFAPSGVYFVRLRAAEGSATSKFVLLPR
jgi:hypothetical protein